MLNYRFVALLVLLACIASPLIYQWITEPDGSWLRPYGVWLLLVIAAWLIQRRHKKFAPDE